MLPLKYCKYKKKFISYFQYGAGYSGPFYRQDIQSKDCTVYTLNNFLKNSIDNYIKKKDILLLTRKNKKNKDVHIAFKGSDGGLIVDWFNLLNKLITDKYLIYNPPYKNVHELINNEAFYGLIGNLQYSGISQGHAVCIVKDDIDKQLYLLNSLESQPILINNLNQIKNISIYIVLIKTKI